MLIKPNIRGQADSDGAASNTNNNTTVLGSQAPFAGNRSWQDLRWNGHRLVPENAFTPEPANLVNWPFNTSNNTEVTASTVTVLVVVGSSPYEAALHLATFDESTSSFVIPEGVNPRAFWFSSRSGMMEPIEAPSVPEVVFVLPRGDAMLVPNLPTIRGRGRFVPPIPHLPTFELPIPGSTVRRAPPSSISAVLAQELQHIQSHLIKISLFLPSENRAKQLETITDVLITWGNEINPISSGVPSDTTCPVCEEHTPDMVKCLNGHFTCVGCYNQLLQVRCPICRNTEMFRCTSDTTSFSSVYSSDEQLTAIIHRMAAATLQSDGHTLLQTQLPFV